MANSMVDHPSVIKAGARSARHIPLHAVLRDLTAVIPALVLRHVVLPLLPWAVCAKMARTLDIVLPVSQSAHVGDTLRRWPASLRRLEITARGGPWFDAASALGLRSPLDSPSRVYALLASLSLQYCSLRGGVVQTMAASMPALTKLEVWCDVTPDDTCPHLGSTILEQQWQGPLKALSLRLCCTGGPRWASSPTPFALPESERRVFASSKAELRHQGISDAVPGTTYQCHPSSRVLSETPSGVAAPVDSFEAAGAYSVSVVDPASRVGFDTLTSLKLFLGQAGSHATPHFVESLVWSLPSLEHLTLHSQNTLSAEESSPALACRALEFTTLRRIVHPIYAALAADRKVLQSRVDFFAAARKAQKWRRAVDRCQAAGTHPPRQPDLGALTADETFAGVRPFSDVL